MLRDVLARLLAIVLALAAVGAAPAFAGDMADPAHPGSAVLPAWHPNDPRYRMQGQPLLQAELERLNGFERLYRAQLLGFALQSKGKFIPSAAQQHECANFVIAALAASRMMPGDTSSRSGYYTWGRKLDLAREAILPGDIIQLVGVRLSYRTPTSWGSWATATQHTALVLSTSGNGLKLHVMQQNAPYGHPVEEGDIDLNWHVDSGTYAVYRPYVIVW